jgi:hypothetical protein
MVKAKLDDGSLSDATEQGATAAEESIDREGDDRSAVIATVATVAVVGIGTAAFEAALLPGFVPSVNLAVKQGGRRRFHCSAMAGSG